MALFKNIREGWNPAIAIQLMGHFSWFDLGDQIPKVKFKVSDLYELSGKRLKSSSTEVDRLIQRWPNHLLLEKLTPNIFDQLRPNIFEYWIIRILNIFQKRRGGVDEEIFWPGQHWTVSGPRGPVDLLRIFHQIESTPNLKLSPFALPSNSHNK